MLHASRNRPAAALAALLLLPALLLPALVPGAAEEAGGLRIVDAWARATPRGAQVAGAYLSITNRGAEPDTLTGGSAEVAARFELHDMTMTDGVMRMRPTGPLVIPPGATLTLSPRGRHIMLSGLKHGLSEGEIVQGTLTFARAGTLPVRFAVEGIGAMAPGGAARGHPQGQADGHGEGHGDGHAGGHAMPGMKMD